MNKWIERIMLIGIHIVMVVSLSAMSVGLSMTGINMGIIWLCLIVGSLVAIGLSATLPCLISKRHQYPSTKKWYQKKPQLSSIENRFSRDLPANHIFDKVPFINRIFVLLRHIKDPPDNKQIGDDTSHNSLHTRILQRSNQAVNHMQTEPKRSNVPAIICFLGSLISLVLSTGIFHTSTPWLVVFGALYGVLMTCGIYWVMGFHSPGSCTKYNWENKERKEIQK
jgi:hypothetical protein